MKSILLVGHRATGKTTICKGLRSFGFESIDLDQTIEEESERTPAQWVRESEMAFRQKEIATLRELVSHAGPQPRVISVGAGCLSFPPEALVVWIFRDGWQRDAKAQRERLRDDLSFEEEVAWMEANREPTWRTAAHLRVDIPQGRAEHRVIQEVGTLVEWLLQVQESRRVANTWIVPTDRTLNRALIDANQFGFAGIEARDDLLRTPVEASGVLASVRNMDSDWVASHPQAAAFDVDVELVADVLARDAFDGLEPRPLLLSTHPDRVDPLDIERLVATARDVESTLPAWAPHIVFKYAPVVESFDQLGFARALIRPLHAAGLATTFLPQGALASFCRPILGPTNATNYISSSLKASRVGGGLPDVTPFDFQDWLPFFAGPSIDTYRALIGTNATKSQGDIWHRKRSIEGDGTIGYLKVDVAHDVELESCLAQLRDLNIHQLSVTSPFKRRFTYDLGDTNGARLKPVEAQVVDTPVSQIAFANTLNFDDGRWTGVETDSTGMRAALDEVGDIVTPGTIALIGRGGVAAAVKAAIRDSDWTLALHVGSRDGWGDVQDRFALVVNASGRPQFHGAPQSDAWLDLHYHGTVAHDGVPYFIGDKFFEAQAEAQWRWWSVETTSA